jgi:hypothetical protein
MRQRYSKYFVYLIVVTAVAIALAFAFLKTA